MRIVKYMLLAVAATFVFSGCAGSYMVDVPDNKIESTPEDKATIVFMRSSFILSAIGAELFEVKDGQLSFIGYLANGTKIAHQTEPGEKVYMAFGNAADFMTAKVRAGKTYFSIVRPNWGTGGFAPTPVRTDGTTDYNTSIPAFQSWVNSTTLREANHEEAQKWFEEHKEFYQKIYHNYWTRFQTKLPDEKAQRFLSYTDEYTLN